MLQANGIDQTRGLQFEIWCERLFRHIAFRGYADIRRNVHYHKNGAYRQVDLEYFNLFSLDEHFVILEMKYVSNGYLNLDFRNGEKKKKNDQIMPIDNIVQELEERRRFVGADTAIMVTNGKGSNALLEEALKYDMKVYEKEHLRNFDKIRRLGFQKNLNKQIRAINCDKYDNTPTNVYL